MPRIEYHGPLDGVDIPLVRLAGVRPGDEFDATDEQAALLLAQPDNFRAAAKAKRTAPADAQEG
ncbi:MAG: hypothetical protein ACRCSL_08445 [Microbacterium sp.]